MNEIIITVSGHDRFPECDEYTLAKLNEGIERTLEFCSVEYPTEVSVSFFDEAEIHSLNLKYRGQNRPTDVLSFPMYTEDELSAMADTDETVTLGDIAICIDRAKEQAKELGNTLCREICFLAIHSTLHLLGYDHERSAEDDERQCEAQRAIIEKIEFDK